MCSRCDVDTRTLTHEHTLTHTSPCIQIVQLVAERYARVLAEHQAQADAHAASVRAAALAAAAAQAQLTASATAAATAVMLKVVSSVASRFMTIESVSRRVMGGIVEGALTFVHA